MKIYNSFAVQYKARLEMKSNQDKLANEVKQYPEKLKLFKQEKQDYEAVYNDAMVVAGDIGIEENSRASQEFISEAVWKLGTTQNQEICRKAYSRLSMITNLGVNTEDLLDIYILFIRSVTENCCHSPITSLT